MDEILKQILSELRQLNRRVENLENGQKGLEAGQKGLEAGQKELYQLFSGLEEHTKVTRSMVVKLSEDVDRLKGDVAGLDNKIDGVEQRLDARIDAAERRLNARIDGLEKSFNVDYILHKIAEHDMQIFNLNKKVG